MCSYLPVFQPELLLTSPHTHSCCQPMPPAPNQKQSHPPFSSYSLPLYSSGLTVLEASQPGSEAPSQVLSGLRAGALRAAAQHVFMRLSQTHVCAHTLCLCT